MMAFATGPLYPSPQSLDPDHPLSLAQKEDLKAAGLTLLEMVICALAEGGPSAATSSDALQRLLCDVFQMDVPAFRSACSAICCRRKCTLCRPEAPSGATHRIHALAGVCRKHVADKT